MERRVTIQWTSTAKEQLAKLPLKVRRGILDKADKLLECSDPRAAHKPLHGPLDGYYRLTYARFRAVYTVEEDRLANGDILARLCIFFIAAGKRKEHDKEDIYRIAENLVSNGIIELKMKTSKPGRTST